MPVTLWHFTSPENAVSILAVGFRDNESGYSQFSAAGDTTFDVCGPALIKVALDVTDEDLDLKGFKKVSVDMHKRQAGPLVKIEDPADYRWQVTYDIPAAFLNAHKTTVRLATTTPPGQARN